jgi:hypothetical protein
VPRQNAEEKAMSLQHKPKMRQMHKGMAVGDIQLPKKPVAKHICKRHKWLQRKFYWECTRCGISEDKTTTPPINQIEGQMSGGKI